MNRSELLIQLKNLLQTDNEISESTNLLDIDEWDSLAIMTVISFVDKNFNKKILFSDLQAIDTVEELLNLIG